jgi:enoyl-CoA hydratase
MPETLRAEIRNGVCHIVLTRAAEYNTITPALRDELAAAVDAADEDSATRVILLRAEGPAFCAGYGLDWATRPVDAATGDEEGSSRMRAASPAAGGVRDPGRSPSGTARGDATREGAPLRNEEPPDSADPDTATAHAARIRQRAPWKSVAASKAWDSVADHRMMSRFVATYMKLWYARKPTLAAVQGWCIGGGTDLVLCADLVMAGEGARFGYPPARVWGTPTTAMWVYRMGLEKAKRYLLTGDEIPAAEAARIGMILECVPDAELAERATALAERMALLPTNQLVMLKLLCNQTAEHMGMGQTRLLGTLFDGIARHTQEGLDFVARSETVGFRQAVRERDDPFGDYGSRKKR